MFSSQYRKDFGGTILREEEKLRPSSFFSPVPPSVVSSVALFIVVAKDFKI